MWRQVVVCLAVCACASESSDESTDDLYSPLRCDETDPTIPSGTGVLARWTKDNATLCGALNHGLRMYWARCDGFDELGWVGFDTSASFYYDAETEVLVGGIHRILTHYCFGFVPTHQEHCVYGRPVCSLTWPTSAPSR